MKSNSFSKTAYPNLKHDSSSPGFEGPFRDDNLRDPLSQDRFPATDEFSINSTFRQSMDLLDHTSKHLNQEKGIPDIRNHTTIGMSKTQSSPFIAQKQKKLKPLTRTSDGGGLHVVSNSATLRPSEYGVSDFYLTNFLGKDKKNPDTKRSQNFTGIQPNYMEGTSLRSSNLEGTRAKGLAKTPAEVAHNTLGSSLKARFYDSLVASQKEFFMDKKDFMKIFDDIDVAMFCMEEVLQRVKCYRFELGSLLEKCEVSYKRILEKMLELTIKISDEKDIIHDKKMEENFQGIKTLENEKKGLEEKNKQYKTLNDVTESEANIYKFNVKSLQNEVSMLYELLKKDYLVQERNDKFSGDEKEEIELTRAVDGGESSKQLAKNLLTLQESIKNLESEQQNKGEKLQEMNNLLKAMLRGGKKEASTQVDEGELAWSAKNIIGQGDHKPKASDFEVYESASVNVEPQLQEQVLKEGTNEEVDPIHLMKFKDKLDKKTSEGPHSMMEQSKATGKNVGNLQIQIPIVDTWTLPLSIIVFLENVTKGHKTANVLPWPFFKRIILEVYQEKITNTFEFQSVLINTAVTMAEFLPIYFLKRYRLRRTAEMKMLEFAVSLKYYVKSWQRAAMFANMCNISNTKYDKDGNPVATFPDFDIYAQSFFLFAYSKVMADVAWVYDHPEGTSFLFKEKVEDLTNEIISFENEANRKKFIAGLNKFQRTFNDNGREGEGVDIDKLLSLYMEVYFEVRTRNNQVLTKHFYKQQSTGEGVFSLDEIKQMTAELIEVESPLLGYTYPKELSVCRAFLYALTSGKNTFGITYKDFILGISRFASIVLSHSLT